MLDDTQLSVRDGKLFIGWQEGAGWSHNGDHCGVDIDISLPAITEAMIGESGSIDIDRIDGDRFTAMLFSSGGITIDEMDVHKLDVLQSGAGELSIANLHADTVDVNLSGSGAMRANGRAAIANLMVFGGGSFDNPRFVAADATIIVGGSGGVRAAVTHHADIRSLGSGEIDVTGGATCTVSHNSGPIHA